MLKEAAQTLLPTVGILGSLALAYDANSTKNDAYSQAITDGQNAFLSYPGVTELMSAQLITASINADGQEIYTYNPDVDNKITGDISNLGIEIHTEPLSDTSAETSVYYPQTIKGQEVVNFIKVIYPDSPVSTDTSAVNLTTSDAMQEQTYLKAHDKYYDAYDNSSIDYRGITTITRDKAEQMEIFAATATFAFGFIALLDIFIAIEYLKANKK